MTTQNEPIPEWLTTFHSPEKTQSNNKHLINELDELTYTSMFESVLDQLSQGVALTEILRTDVRNPNCAKFMRWIHKDSQRKARYYESQEIGAELVAADMIYIADASDTLEDVQRSKLRIDTRKFLLGVWNKKRFGEIKQIELGGTISITDALTAANSRLINAAQTAIEVELIEESNSFLALSQDEEE